MGQTTKSVRNLDVDASQIGVYIDSPSGVEAALNAGMWCIAVTTPFTKENLHQGGLLEERWIVDDPTTLAEVVERMMGAFG